MTIETSASAIDQIVAAAAAVAPEWAASDKAMRTSLLNGLAQRLEEAQSELVSLADEETYLGAGRLNGELARTSFQLRGFAHQVTKGVPFSYVDDPAVAGPPPSGHPAMLRARVPVGPVAMFSASNFPFAFSVLGGDTASALAAGCPVVVKAHPGHPRLSRRVHQLATEVLAGLGLPAALLGLVEGASIDVGVQLIRHPSIAAAAFTGSVRGGLALQAEANARPRPIPFYGELGSVNPVVVLPSAVANKEAELALTLAQSITNGTGQFCTSPGIVMVFDDESTQRFVTALASALREQKTHPMLTPAIRSGFDAGVKRLSSQTGVAALVSDPTEPTLPPKPFLARTDARTFIQNSELHDEVFGPAALVVDVRSADEIVAVLEAIGGSLTATLWGADEETELNVRVVRAATRVAGRVLFAGVPTGVAVTDAQHHGGPWPSSTQPFTTSVGYASIDRFLRPVAMQDAPDWIAKRAGRPA